MTLCTRNQLAIGLLMALLMILTRSHHFASMHNLADASWAIFFLAGVYMPSAWPLLGFFLLSWWLDFAAYTWGGVSDFCLTPAYAFLLPAYASLWLAGYWYNTKYYQPIWRTVIPFIFSISIGLTLCGLFSSGGFYFFSGRFANTSLPEFGEQLIKYFPLYGETFLFYISITLLIHALYILISKTINAPFNTTFRQWHD